MKSIYCLFFIAILGACSSQKTVVTNSAKPSKYRVYQYKNKLVKTASVPVVTALSEQGIDTESNSLKHETAEPVAAINVATVVINGTDEGSSKFRKTTSSLPMQGSKDKVDDYKRATKAGTNGLMFSTLGFILTVVSLFAGIPILFGLAIIALFVGLGASLYGLKGGHRKQAIAGIIVAGIPLVIGIVGLIFYIIRM